MFGINVIVAWIIDELNTDKFPSCCGLYSLFSKNIGFGISQRLECIGLDAEFRGTHVEIKGKGK